MCTEDYVTLEVARLLKEKGFKEMCHAYWWVYKNLNRLDNYDYRFTKEWLEANHECYDEVLLAPTLYEAQKWLRKEKGLYVEVSYMTGDYYIYDILTIPQHDLVGLNEPRHFSYPNTYEEVLNAGIFEALKLI